MSSTKKSTQTAVSSNGRGTKSSGTVIPPAEPRYIFLRPRNEDEKEIEDQTYHLIGGELPFSVLDVDYEQNAVLVRLDTPYSCAVSNRLEGIRDAAGVAVISPEMDDYGTIVSFAEPDPGTTEEMNLIFFLSYGDHFHAAVEMMITDDKRVPVTMAEIIFRGIGPPNSSGTCDNTVKSPAQPEPKRSKPQAGGKADVGDKHLCAHFSVAVIPMLPDKDE